MRCDCLVVTHCSIVSHIIKGLFILKIHEFCHTKITWDGRTDRPMDGRADGRMEQRTDGHDLLWKCVVTSKNRNRNPIWPNLHVAEAITDWSFQMDRKYHDISFSTKA